jgi:hypothetical protein
MNVIATFNPHFILRQNARLSGLFEFALGRAVQASQGVKFLWSETEFILRPSADEVEERLAAMAGKAVAFDVETDGNHPLCNQLRCIGFHDGEVGLFVPLLYRPGEREEVPERDRKGNMTLVGREVWRKFYAGKAELKVLRAMKRLLEQDAGKLYTQNGQYDRMVLKAQLGFDIPAGNSPKAFDTLLAHHILAPYLPHDLGLLASLYTNAPFYKKTESGGWAASTDHELALYNLRDVKATWLIAEKMQQEIRTEYKQAPAIYVQDAWQERECEEWKRAGFLVDQPTLRFFRYSYTTRRDRALEAMRKLLGQVGIGSEDENFKALLEKLASKADEMAEDEMGATVELFNPGSLIQLRQMLAGLKIPLEEVTSSGQLSTAKEILTGARKELLVKGAKPNDPRVAFLDYLFAWREAAKVVGTYLYPEVLADGRVHPTFSVHVVPTGRLSSSGPNFQNQPAEVRGMFVARPGHTIVSQDWDALEMRLGAFLSEDPKYMEVFRAYDSKTGPKPHHANMAAIFGLEPTKKAAEQNPGMYRAAKVFAYAVAYGAGEDTVYEQVREELPDMKWESFLEAFNRYKKTYPQLFAFQAEVVRQGTKQGYLASGLLGRRVYFFERSWGGTSPEATAMQNFPYQSTGSDIVGQANKRVMDRLVLPWRKSRLGPSEVIEQLAQVHDELVFEVPLRIADEFCTECKRISEEKPVGYDGVTRDWNLPVDIHHDRRWKPVQARCACRELVDVELVAEGRKRRDGVTFDLWEGECDACKQVKRIEIPY